METLRQRAIVLFLVAGGAAGAAGALTGDEGAVIRLVPPEAKALTGPVRIETVTSREPIDRVVFYLDGLEAAVATRHPFAVRLDLGREARPRELRATAFDAAGRELGTDRLRLESSPQPPGVAIASLEATTERGVFEVVAEVRPPPRRAVERLELHWGSDLLATVDRPPWRVRVRPSEPSPDDVVAALVRLDDGTTLESARLAGAPVDHLEVRLVELLATVTDRASRPRADLERDDFTIYDRGTVRPVAHFARAGELPLELGLVIDTSDSMRIRHHDLRHLATRLLERILRPVDRAFLVDFNSGPRLAHPVSSDLGSLVAGFEDLEIEGGTRLYDAILYALLALDPGASRRALAVLTDGEASADGLGPDRVVREARRLGVPIYLLNLGERPDPRRHPRRILTERIARETGGRVFYLPAGARVEPVCDRLEEELASQYLLAYAPAPGDEGRRPRGVRVEVRGRGLDVRAVQAWR